MTSARKMEALRPRGPRGGDFATGDQSLVAQVELHLTMMALVKTIADQIFA